MDNQFIIKFLRFLSVSAILVGFFLIGKYTFIYIYPFIIALLVAFILNPLVTKIQFKCKLNRTIATLCIMMSFFTLFTTGCFFLLKRLLEESTSLIESLPEQFKNIKLLLTDIGQAYLLPTYEKLTKTITFLPPTEEIDINQYIHLMIDELGSSSSYFLKNIILSTSTVLSSLSYVGTIIIFILLASFLMTKDLEQLKVHLYNNVPKRFIQKLQPIFKHLKSSVFGFLKAQIIITTISSLIVMVSLFIFKVENVLMITLTTFFVDFIPYVGIGAIFIPWIIYNFFTEQYILTIQLSCLYIGIIIIRQIIEPRILASSIGLHPLVALIILFIGIQSLGLIGIFITPIALIIISAIYHAGIVHYIWRFIKNG